MYFLIIIKTQTFNSFVIKLLGHEYEGQWKKGLKHGIGKLKLTNGSYYIGRFKSGQKSGYGKELVLDELNKAVSLYTGKWREGKKKGRGVLKLITGAMYEGDFDDNKYHGQGKFIHPNGIILEGKFLWGSITSNDS